MTQTEAIIMGAATRSAKVRSSRELADRVGMKYTTLRHKMNRPKSVDLGDLHDFDRVCQFTGDEALKLIKSIRG